MIKEVENLDNDKLYLKVRKMTKIANEAVFKAKQENKKYGILEYFTKNGKLYLVLPNGEITTQKP